MSTSTSTITAAEAQAIINLREYVISQKIPHLYRRVPRDIIRQERVTAWGQQNADKLAEAFTNWDGATVNRLGREIRNILQPHRHVEIIGFFLFQFGTPCFFGCIPLTFGDLTRNQACIAAISAVTTHVFVNKLWFTFRDRLTVHFNLPRIHPDVSLRGGILDDFTLMCAVGHRAYRSAPLPDSWIWLTGREKLEPAWRRHMIIFLTIIASTGIFWLVPAATILVMISIHLWSIHTPYIYLNFALLTLSFYTLLFINLHQRVPNRILVQSAYRIMVHFGYQRDQARPIIRSFVDQMLATYRIPNPGRNEELRRDQLLVQEQTIR